MKISVLTLDKQIITLDVDPNDLVGDIKASLNVKQQELLYDGKEMKNDEKLSEVGVQEGDSIVVASDSAPISSSSTTELSLNPDGSAMNVAAFQHKILHNSKLVAQLVQSYPEFAQAIAENDHNRLQAFLRQHHQQIEEMWQRDGELGITNFEDAPRNVEGEACLAALPEKETSSHLLDGEKFSEQEPVDSNDEVNEEVDIQVNGGSTHAEKNDHNPHDRHILNSGDKESSTASIQKLGSIDHNDSNFFASHEHVDMSANNSKGTEAVSSELLPLSPNSPQTTKGHGLKKWRRIRREVTKESTSNVDSTKGLKRGSSKILDVKKSNDGSVSSTCAFVNSPGHTDLFSNPTPSSSYPVPLGTTFSAGADDSDDRSSKSSTAASAPKYKHDHQREKHRLKNVSGRHLNSSGQRSQLAKGNTQVDTSKKPRGERIKVEKENSLSSMESDSRSYSSVFRRGSSSVNSDQVQSGNYNEEDDNDQLASEGQAYNKLLAAAAGHRKNGNLSPDCSVELSCSANMGRSKDQQVSSDREPLINSIMLLQSAQEALEREVHLFREIGKGVHSLCDDSSKATTGVDHRYSSNEEFDHVQTLENQLEEAHIRLKEEDLKVIELKKMVKSMIMKSSPQADERGPIEFQHNLWQEMEAELENVFKLKVEAEALHVVMMGSRNDLGVLIEDQIKFLRDQNFDASRKLVADVRNDGSILQSQSKLVNLDTDMTEDENLQDMRSRIGKYSSYLVIQLVFFVIVVGVFLLRVLPKSATVVPT